MFFIYETSTFFEMVYCQLTVSIALQFLHLNKGILEMKFKRFFSTAALIVVSTMSQAELKSLEASNINSYSSNIYPNLNLNDLDQIKIEINQTATPNSPLATVEINKVEFEFPNANNLKAKNLTKVNGTPNTYRTVVTSPWVFKKVLVELSGAEDFDGINFSYKVFVMDSTSNINNIEQTQGLELLSGNAELINVTAKKVVDIANGRYLGKELILRLLHNTNLEGIRVEATWFGHGTKILTLPSPFDARLYPVALILDRTPGNSRIKARFDNGTETSDESLHALLEQAFGPLPQ